MATSSNCPELRVVRLALNNTCNMRPRCVTCFVQNTETQTAMAEEAVVSKVIGQIDRLDRLILGGLGEPSMHPMFWRLIENGQGKVEFLTNGLFLKDDVVPRLVGNVHSMHISLDAANAETYAKMRKAVATFRRITRVTKEIIAARTEGCGPLISISFVRFPRSPEETQYRYLRCSNLKIMCFICY